MNSPLEDCGLDAQGNRGNDDDQQNYEIKKTGRTRDEATPHPGRDWEQPPDTHRAIDPTASLKVPTACFTNSFWNDFGRGMASAMPLKPINMRALAPEVILSHPRQL